MTKGRTRIRSGDSRWERGASASSTSSGGHQPLCNEDGTIWAVLNGEIYNSPALQERLRLRGHRFASRADTETLVHLYEEYQEDMVHALAGMFAFAIWDERRGRLLLGRDRFGEKPLFVRRGDRGLCFASELSALVQIAARKPDLDLDSVDMYMVLGYVPGPRTIVQGIEQLSAGPSVDVGRRGRRSRCPPILVGESLSDGGTGSGGRVDRRDGAAARTIPGGSAGVRRARSASSSAAAWIPPWCRRW